MFFDLGGGVFGAGGFAIFFTLLDRRQWRNNSTRGGCEAISKYFKTFIVIFFLSSSFGFKASDDCFSIFTAAFVVSQAIVVVELDSRAFRMALEPRVEEDSIEQQVATGLASLRLTFAKFAIPTTKCHQHQRDCRLSVFSSPRDEKVKQNAEAN